MVDLWLTGKWDRLRGRKTPNPPIDAPDGGSRRNEARFQQRNGAKRSITRFDQVSADFRSLTPPQSLHGYLLLYTKVCGGPECITPNTCMITMFGHYLAPREGNGPVVCGISRQTFDYPYPIPFYAA
jgi:hypothetical protein